MTISEQHKKNHPSIHESWLRMNHAILKLAEAKGDSAVKWENLSTERCKWWEQFAKEEEFYTAAAIYRDGIHKCFDYKNEKRRINHR